MTEKFNTDRLLTAFIVFGVALSIVMNVVSIFDRGKLHETDAARAEVLLILYDRAELTPAENAKVRTLWSRAGFDRVRARP